MRWKRAGSLVSSRTERSLPRLKMSPCDCSLAPRGAFRLACFMWEHGYCKRILPDAGILKIGEALGVGTGTVQRLLMEQPRPFDVDAAEGALLLNKTEMAAGGPQNNCSVSNARLAPDAMLMGWSPKLIARAE